MRKKVFLFILATLLLFPLFSKQTFAECSDPLLPPIPVETKVDQGKVTITIKWSQIDYDTWYRSQYAQGVGSQIPIYVLAVDSNNDLPSSVFNVGNVDDAPNHPKTKGADGKLSPDSTFNFQFTDDAAKNVIFTVHLSDPEHVRIDGNHVTFVNGSCTFEKNPAPTFVIQSTENPGLSEGDQCLPGSDESTDPLLKCPNGTFCRSPQGLPGGEYYCLKPIEDGQSCIANKSAPQCAHGDCVNGVCGASLLPPPCPSAHQDANGNCTLIETGFGQISTGVAGFTKWVLGFILSVAGTIVLIIIIITGYRLMTSQGDPEKVKEAREGLTAAILGLLFIIFSLVILQFITVDVLHIPGFNP